MDKFNKSLHKTLNFFANNSLKKINRLRKRNFEEFNKNVLKYAEEFANQITDWIKNNSVGFGVNWSCTMDVAIRAANWLVAKEHFSEEGLIPDNFWNEFYTSIYEHGKFIIKHLEIRSC